MRFSYRNVAKCSQTNVLQNPNPISKKSLIYSIFNTASIKPNSYPSYSSTAWWCPPVCSWFSESLFLRRVLGIEWQLGSDIKPSSVLFGFSSSSFSSSINRTVLMT